MQTKVKSFTLNEVLVVLALTAVVVGMAFSVLRLVQGQMSGIGDNYQKGTEWGLLKQSLWIDFNRADKLLLDSDNGVLTVSTPLKSEIYQFTKDKIIKSRDTFHLEYGEIRFSFNGERVYGGEVDALQIFKPQSDKPGLMVFKNNTASTFMNQP